MDKEETSGLGQVPFVEKWNIKLTFQFFIACLKKTREVYSFNSFIHYM